MKEIQQSTGKNSNRDQEVDKVDNQIYIDRLFEARKLSSPEEYEQFESSLIALQENIQICDISKICKVFYDDTQDEEVMFGLIHFIEQFPKEEYLQCIAMCSPDMTDAHDWAMILNKRILNNQEYFDKYVEIICDIKTPDKTKIMNLLMDVKEDCPDRFGEKVDWILRVQQP